MHANAPLAQSVERAAVNRKVIGSNPIESVFNIQIIIEILIICIVLFNTVIFPNRPFCRFSLSITTPIYIYRILFVSALYRVAPSQKLFSTSTNKHGEPIRTK